MAYRRSIVARSKLFYQQHHRFAPLFSHISGSDREESPAKRNSEIRRHFLFTRNIAGNSLLSGNASRLVRSEVPAGYGLSFHRNLSNVPSHTEDLNGMIGVVGDKAGEVAPVVNEVAVAAADSFAPVVNEVAVAAAYSFAPVAAFQYLIDHVHCYTGFEWWASIAATTLLIRFVHLPFLIYNIKFLSKNSTTLSHPTVRTFKRVFTSKSGEELKKASAPIWEYYNKLGKFPSAGLAMAHVNACFLFFAVLNMAEKVPSFVTGGTLWYTDLTIPNKMGLPFLLALTYWIRLQLDPVPYAQGIRPCMYTDEFHAKLVFLGAYAAGLPTAVYYFWITSNLFSAAFGSVVMNPRVQKLLGISLISRSTHKETSSNNHKNVQ